MLLYPPEPPKSYKSRLFTTNEAGVGGVAHIGEDKVRVQSSLECFCFACDLHILGVHCTQTCTFDRQNTEF